MKIRLRLIFIGIYLVLLGASHLYRHVIRKPAPLKPEQTAIESLGLNMAYEDVGPSDAPVLLLLHGSPMDSGGLDALRDQLKDRYRLIIPDLPGFGRSEQKVPDLSILAHAKYIEDLISKLGLKDLHIVGYSMGGGVGIHLIDSAPENFASFTMLASIGVQEHELLGDYLINHAIHGMQLSIISLVQEVVPHFGLLDRFPLNRNFARNFYETDQRPLREMLKKWQGPTLIIHGENDFLVPPSAAREHARIVPQSQLRWIKDGSHIDVMTRPDQVATLIDTFIQKDLAVTATAERIAQSQLAPQNRQLDATKAGTTATASLLAAATLGSEDLTCISAGLLASRGVINFLTAVLGCMAGIVLGDLGLFLLGKWFGVKALHLPPLKWMISADKLDSSRDWLDKNGAKVIFATRFIPGSRLPVYFGMGSAGMSLSKFAFWFVIAASIWTPILIGISMLFGHAFLPWFEENEKWILPGIIGLMVFLAFMVKFVCSISTWKGRRILVSKWKRFTQWEFWPAPIVYIPFFFYYLFLAIRHRSLFVFTAANPGIPCGGFAYEPKLISLEGLKSSGSVAKFAIIHNADDLYQFLEENDLSYPVVIKPNVGERGTNVAIAKSQQEVAEYFAEDEKAETEYLAQEYIGGEEFGVFYYRYPSAETGKIFGITKKEMVTVTGDGKQTLEQLILTHPRAICMARFFLNKHHDRLEKIIPKGEDVALSTIGNHCRGAVFLDGTDLVTPELEQEIDRICRSFEGFYFGRFDVKVPSTDAFQDGKDIKVLELNGVTSEVSGMYDPKYSFWQGLSILTRQWKICFEIGEENRKNGFPVSSLKDIVKNLKEYRDSNSVN